MKKLVSFVAFLLVFAGTTLAQAVPTVYSINGLDTTPINTMTQYYGVFSSSVNNDVIKFVMNWGDGSRDSTTHTVSANQQFGAFMAHQWATAGVKTITGIAYNSSGASAPVTKTVTVTGPANSAPVASNVTITGSLVVGQTVTGSYTYADANSDLQGVSTFRWLRNDVAIAGATSITYVLTAADLGTSIKFEVTPVALTGVLTGTPVQSAGSVLITDPVNNPPDITNVIAVNIFQNQPCVIKVTLIDKDDTEVWLKYKYESIVDSIKCDVVPNVYFQANVIVTFSQAGLSSIEFIVRDSHSIGGTITISVNVSAVTGVEDLSSVPTEYKLNQNYPNPFNPTTTISYSLPEQANVKVYIFNALGEAVAQLVNQEQGIGRHSVVFNATNIASGIYFCKIQAGKFTDTKKLILMK